MQKVILDLLPGGVAPIVYASQYDDGRSIRFMLTEGGPDDQYILNSSEVITCNLTKPDGTETVINVANPGAGKTYVDLVNGADDYDQAGAYLGEIVLTRNTKVIGSANFVLKVEEDAYGGQITTLTATGNPCTFDTDLADNLVSLTAEIVASGGGGTPSTPIPINGYTEANITRCGVNLVNVGYNEYYPLHFTEDKTIVASCDLTVGYPQIAFYDKNQTFIDYWGMSSKFSSVPNRMAKSFTYPSNAYYISFRSSQESTNYQIELGSINTAYTPYNGQTYTIAFGQTVYGGVLDVTRGKLHVTWARVDLGTLEWGRLVSGGKVCFKTSAQLSDAKKRTTSSELMGLKCTNYFEDTWVNTIDGAGSDGSIALGWNNNAYIGIYDSTKASMTAADFKTAMNGVLLAYELATPIDIDLTPVQISALVGTNNITSDLGGDVSVTYIKKV